MDRKESMDDFKQDRRAGSSQVSFSICNYKPCDIPTDYELVRINISLHFNIFQYSMFLI